MERVSQDPSAPDFVQDPSGFYAEARAAGDLVFWEDRGRVAAVSHRAVNGLLRDRRFGRPPLEQPPLRPGLETFDRLDRLSILELEPPEHTRFRKLISDAFTSRRIAALEPLIRRLSDELVAGLFDDGPEADLLEKLARPLPLAVITDMMSLPRAEGADLLTWSNAMVRMYQAGRTAADEARAEAAAQAFEAYLLDAIAARADAPDEGLLSGLIAAGLTRDETVATAILLLNAGHEATVHMIGNGVVRLLAEGVTAPGAAEVEECLRLDPPLHLFTRTAYEPVELFGHRFEPGETVDLLLACANRDEAAYEDAARFVPGRKGPTAVGFGAGLHFCIGAPLARLELVTALGALFAAHPGLRLVRPAERADTWHFHGQTAVWVTT